MQLVAGQSQPFHNYFSLWPPDPNLANVGSVNTKTLAVLTPVIYTHDCRERSLHFKSVHLTIRGFCQEKNVMGWTQLPERSVSIMSVHAIIRTFIANKERSLAVKNVHWQ